MAGRKIGYVEGEFLKIYVEETRLLETSERLEEIESMGGNPLRSRNLSGQVCNIAIWCKS
jgi:hypothetical protein